jgi:hypothetical protein
MQGTTTPTRPADRCDEAREIVRDFLRTMEARDLDRAQGFLAQGFAMCFPGGARMTRLDQLVAHSARRYRNVTKTFDAFEAFADAAHTVVYCRGTLAGEWLDGSRFSGIRFIDRFALDGDGKIVQQDVWNDMAENRRFD